MTFGFFVLMTYKLQMQERIEVAKYCSHEQIIMFTHMLQRTLDIAVGRKDRPAMSRHAAAAGTRFR